MQTPINRSAAPDDAAPPRRDGQTHAIASAQPSLMTPTPLHNPHALLKVWTLCQQAMTDRNSSTQQLHPLKATLSQCKDNSSPAVWALQDCAWTIERDGDLQQAKHEGDLYRAITDAGFRSVGESSVEDDSRYDRLISALGVSPKPLSESAPNLLSFIQTSIYQSGFTDE